MLQPLLTDPLFILLIGIIVVFGGILWLRLHAFVALLLAAFAVALLTPGSAIEQFALASGSTPEAARVMAERSAGARIGMAFGNTAGAIGILIGMAAIIGKCLLDSGAAERIVRGVLRLTGPDRAPLAYGGASFFLAIPVFFDTVFYLMTPLAKAMAARINKNYLLFVLMIAAGASMAHSLVPPTPGPLFLVSALHIPMHLMIIGGLSVGIVTVTSGYLYATWANRKWQVPLRGSADAPVREIESMAELETKELPGIGLSVLPIVLPVVLISVSGVLNTVASADAAGSGLLAVITFLGEKNTALVIGGLIALRLLAKHRQPGEGGMGVQVQTALMSGGVIILITAAGGAFGTMLQQTGVSARIAEMTQAYQIALIPLAFLITAVVRTAQGSATVSMITAAGIVGGMAANATLGFHVLYLGLAIACGSKLVPWMNDSGFWIVSRMSNLTEAETLKSFSIMQTVMGITGLIVIVLAAKLFPLV